MTNLSQFVKDAIRTESLIDEVQTNTQLLEGTIKTLIAAGNVLDMVKKNVYYGKEIDRSALRQNALLAQVGTLQMDPGNVDLNAKSTVEIDPRLFHAIVGIATESVELLEALDAALKGNPVDAVNVKEELGDINWYQAIAIDTLDADFDAVLDTVIAKLRARYPEKFTSEDAIDRDLDTERKILEG